MAEKDDFERIKADLMRANELLRTVIDENPNIILMKDWNGRFLIGNRALANLYGTTPEGLVGKDDGAFNPNKEQVEFYLKNVRDIMSQNETQVVMEESTNTATGETHYYQSIKKPLIGPDGARQILVIANDVTELRRARNELEESERRLSHVLEVTREGIWDWDLRTDVVTHNSQWCQIFGLDRAYLHHPMADFAPLLHEDDRERVMVAIQQCLDGKAAYQSEHRMRLHDGTVVWVLDRGDVIERDLEGRALRMIGSVTDITERKMAARVLEERESYLRATLDNFPFLIWLKDQHSHFLTVNQVFASAAGRRTPDEIVGLSDFDIWPAELAAAYQADDLEVMRSGSEKSVEEELVTNGERRWIETYKHPVFSASGEVIGTVGFARDITEKHQLAEALAQSELRWQLALEGNNDGIWDWNLVDGSVFFSERWKTMLGFQNDEIANDLKEWSSRVHPDDWPGVQAAIQQHLTGRTSYYQTEHRVRCKDGSYKWILDRGKAICDAGGKPLRMVGSHTDVTERRLVEEKIQDRNEQLDTIFSLSPDGLISFDRADQVKYANQAFLRMTGLSESDVMGLDATAFTRLMDSICEPHTHFPSLAELEERCSDDTQSKRAAIVHISHGPRVLEVSLRASKAHSLSRIAYFRDVTYEWEVAQMKSEFLSTAAHELRTPMASVYGYAELLHHMDFPPEERKEMLGVMLDQSRLVNNIINELLDLARIEARRGKDFVYQPQDAIALCKSAAAAFDVGQDRQLRLELPASSCQVNVDPGKISQALNNVLSNAFKYSPDGGEVVLSLSGREIDGQLYCEFRVQDHGIGMSKQQLERVCERFYRADTSGRIPGTGLGMSIVKEIIDLHQGRIEMDSTPGEGTRVSLLVPALQH